MLNHMGASSRIAFANTLIYTNWNPGTPFVSNCTCALTLNLIQFWLLNRLEQLLICHSDLPFGTVSDYLLLLLFILNNLTASHFRTHMYTCMFYLAFIYIILQYIGMLFFPFAMRGLCVFSYMGHFWVFLPRYTLWFSYRHASWALVSIPQS